MGRNWSGSSCCLAKLQKITLTFMITRTETGHITNTLLGTLPLHKPTWIRPMLWTPLPTTVFYLMYFLHKKMLQVSEGKFWVKVLFCKDAQHEFTDAYRTKSQCITKLLLTTEHQKLVTRMTSVIANVVVFRVYYLSLESGALMTIHFRKNWQLSCFTPKNFSPICTLVKWLSFNMFCWSQI